MVNTKQNNFMLPSFCDRMKSYRNFMNKMNNCMKELIPGCTSYYARHSVASIAAELDVPLDTIARMLGHMDSTRRVTLIYVDFNQNKVDEANRNGVKHNHIIMVAKSIEAADAKAEDKKTKQEVK